MYQCTVHARAYNDTIIAYYLERLECNTVSELQHTCEHLVHENRTIFFSTTKQGSIT